MTRDPTHIPLQWKSGILATGPPGKSCYSPFQIRKQGLGRLSNLPKALGLDLGRLVIRVYTG